MADQGDVYIIEYLAAYEALREASVQAREASQDASLPEDERARAGALSIDLDKQLLLLKVAHETFMGRFTTPTPPTQQELIQVIDLNKQVAQLVEDRLKAEANLDAVIGVINAFNQLASKPAATAPEAAPSMTTAVDKGRADADLMAITTTRWLRTIKAAHGQPR